jgi:uncharacterized C2H2 Zn-finger protein
MDGPFRTETTAPGQASTAQTSMPVSPKRRRYTPRPRQGPALAAKRTQGLALPRVPLGGGLEEPTGRHSTTRPAVACTPCQHLLRFAAIVIEQRSAQKLARFPCPRLGVIRATFKDLARHVPVPASRHVIGGPVVPAE